MNARDHLPVDLADIDDIREKLPRARQLYREKQRELHRLERQVESWGALVDLLGRLVGEPAAEQSGLQLHDRDVRQRTRGGPKRAPGQQQAADALELAGRPMGPSALYRFMIGKGLEAPANANSLGANLWAAARSGRVRKIDEGLYAPLDWEPDE